MSSPLNVPEQSRPPWYKNIYFVVAIVSMILLPLMRPLLRHIPQPPPVLKQLQGFQFTNQFNESFGSDQLSGRVYVASFLFTRCTTVCPLTAAAVALLQEKFNNAKLPIDLVSFSVDPEWDQPEKLNEYQKQYVKLNPENATSKWSLLTAPKAKMESLLIEGFSVAMDPIKETPTSLFDISHSRKLVLVDQSNKIRGYYSSDTDGIDEVFNRAQHVLYEGAAR